MARWIIQDWTGHRVSNKVFKNFYNARAEISDIATRQADALYETDTPEWQEDYDGTCEDLYAIKVDRNGNELQPVDADFELREG